MSPLNDYLFVVLFLFDRLYAVRDPFSNCTATDGAVLSMYNCKQLTHTICSSRTKRYYYSKLYSLYEKMHSSLSISLNLLCVYATKAEQNIGTDIRIYLLIPSMYWYEESSIASVRQLPQTLNKTTIITTAAYAAMTSRLNRLEYLPSDEKKKKIELIFRQHVCSIDKTFYLLLCTTNTDNIQQIVSMPRSSQSVHAWVIFSQNYQMLTYIAKLDQTQLKDKNDILLPYFIKIMLIDILASVLINMCCISSILKIKSDLINILKLCPKKFVKTKGWSANILFFLLLYNKLDGG